MNQMIKLSQYVMNVLKNPISMNRRIDAEAMVDVIISGNFHLM